MDISIYNTNTARRLIATIELDEDGNFLEEGDYTIAGFKGTGSEVKIAFVHPAGSMTGSLLPTSRQEDVVEVAHPPVGVLPFAVRASLVDAANPFIFVDAESLPFHVKGQPFNSSAVLEAVESIRKVGAVMMGLAENIEAAAKVRGTPKIALLSATPKGTGKDSADIRVAAFSMGQLHPSLQLTGAVCLGAACCVPGTVAHRLARSKPNLLLPSPERTPSPDGEKSERGGGWDEGMTRKQSVRIEHGTGSISVEMMVEGFGNQITIGSGVVSRTVRRLFEGKVLYYA